MLSSIEPYIWIWGSESICVASVPWIGQMAEQPNRMAERLHRPIWNCPLFDVKGKILKVIYRLFRIFDMLYDSIRTNHFQGLIVPADKRSVIEFSFLV